MGCAAALGLIEASLQPARASEVGKPSPTLVVALYARPADRPALRQELVQAQAARLARWRSQGLISGYRLLFTRYADAGVWDGLEVLTFPDEAALSRWGVVERDGAGGLTSRALERVSQVVTTPTEQVRHAALTPGGQAPSFLVVPYAALVSTPDYLKYLDGYTLPQFEGWMSEGVLDGYDIELSRYPADRPWLSLILLRYHDDAALAQRDATTAKVRARLADDPAWKAISDNKKAVRTEKVAAVADPLAVGGVDR